MDHVAILRKAVLSKGDNLLGDILSGAKTIESRWYVNKAIPWNKINIGDTVFLKESGCSITARAFVSNVLQYDNLNKETIHEILTKYGKQIAPKSSIEDFERWLDKRNNKRYCILIFLKDVEIVTPFDIDKTGFGNAAAWLVTENIEKIKL